MVTSYYIMQMSKSKPNINIEYYYSDLCNQSKLKNINSNSCRVCLKKGEVAIYENEDKQDIVKALRIFGDIEIREEDEFPKYLCSICYKFVKEAMLFRKAAKTSYEILRSPVKEETYQTHDYDVYSDEQYENTQSWSDNEQEYIKPEKREKIKLSPKVTCQICNKIVNRSYYKEHLTMHDPNHQKYVCDVCGKSFRLRCAYHNHSLRHRDDFPFKCNFCPYKARYGELLKTHMRTHTGDYRSRKIDC